MQRGWRRKEHTGLGTKGRGRQLGRSPLVLQPPGELRGDPSVHRGAEPAPGADERGGSGRCLRSESAGGLKLEAESTWKCKRPGRIPAWGTAAAASRETSAWGDSAFGRVGEATELEVGKRDSL